MVDLLEIGLLSDRGNFFNSSRLICFVVYSNILFGKISNLHQS